MPALLSISPRAAHIVSAWKPGSPFQLVLESLAPTFQAELLDAVHRAFHNGSASELDWSPWDNGRFERVRAEIQPLPNACAAILLTASSIPRSVSPQAERNLAGFARIDLNGRMRECNEVFALSTGYDSRARLLREGGSAIQFHHPTWTEFMAALRRKGSLQACVLQGNGAGRKPFRLLANAAWSAPEAIELVVIDISRSNEPGMGASAPTVTESETELHNICRQLQAPVRTISGFTQLVQEHAGESLNREAAEFLSLLDTETRGLRATLRDLSHYSRILQRTPVVEKIDLDVILRWVKGLLAGPIESSQARIEQGSLPKVQADAVDLEQVFFQLLSNALRFRREEAPRIYIAATKRGREWLFSIADNGLGIDPVHLQYIFELFARLQPRAKYPGSGIGLTLCRKVVERAGGRLWAESEPGKGSTFYFTLPA